MERFKSIIEALKAKADVYDHGVTFLEEEGDTFVSYNQMYFDSMMVLKQLRDKGAKKGDEMLFQIGDSRTLLTNLWACLLGGMIPVLLTVGTSDEYMSKMFRIWDILQHPYLLTDKKISRAIEVFAKANDKYDAFKVITQRRVFVDEQKKTTNMELNISNEAYIPQPDSLALIQFSSGSTGDPKGIGVSHENLTANIYSTVACADFSEADSMLNWMPLSHTAGIVIFHLLPMSLNINQYVMPTNLFVQQPTLWLRKVSEYQATVTIAPNSGLRDYLADFKKEAANDLDLSSIRLIIDGTEPLSANLCHQFLDEMGKYNLKKSAIYPAYGLSETTAIFAIPLAGEVFAEVSLDRDMINIGQPVREIDKNASNAATFVDVGRIIDGYEARICDDGNTVVDDLTVGYIHVRGKGVISSYYNNRNGEVNQAFLEDGWFNTGDVGFMKKGRLIITGRVKDIIFLSGKNLYPMDIERVAEEAKVFVAGATVATGVFDNQSQTDKIILFVEDQAPIDEFVSNAIRLKNYINIKMGIQVREVIPVLRIPKTMSGKVQRNKLKQAYCNDQFSSISADVQQRIVKKISAKRIEKPKKYIEESLVKIWSAVLNKKAIGINENFFEIGGTSKLLIKMVERVNRDHKGIFSVSDIFGMPTIAQMAEYIEASKAQSQTFVEVPTIEFPSDYIAKETSFNNRYNKVAFRLKNDLVAKLNKISANERLDLNTVLVSLYAFLVSQISEKPKIVLTTAIGKKEQLCSLNFDFSNIGNLQAVIGVIGILQNDFSIKDLKNAPINKNLSAITQIIYCKNYLSEANELLGIFDILIEIEKTNSEVYFTCRYRSGKLKENSIKTLLKQYHNLLLVFIKKYTQVDDMSVQKSAGY